MTKDARPRRISEELLVSSFHLMYVYSYQGRARLRFRPAISVDLVPIELSDPNPKLHVEYTTPFS